MGCELFSGPRAVSFRVRLHEKVKPKFWFRLSSLHVNMSFAKDFVAMLSCYRMDCGAHSLQTFVDAPYSFDDHVAFHLVASVYIWI